MYPFLLLYSDLLADLSTAPLEEDGGSDTARRLSFVGHNQDPAGRLPAVQLHDSRTRSVAWSGSQTLDTPVADVVEALQLVERGVRNRTTRPTVANAASSRSHAVLVLDVQSSSRNAENGALGGFCFGRFVRPMRSPPSRIHYKRLSFTRYP